MATKRKPVWKEVEERDARKLSSRVRSQRSKHNQRITKKRLRVVYDVNGPRVRLGVLWFLLNLAVLTTGRWPFSVLWALTGGVAALQTAKVWRAANQRPDRIVAGAGATAIGIAGAVRTGVVGIAILALVAAALFSAFSAAAANRRRNPVDDASFTIRCALFAGFAVACVAVTARFEYGAAVALILVVSAYETGDYLVGSGSSNPYEGPVAGMTAILVVTFAVTALGIKPFEFPRAFLFGGMACVLCPLGQLAASAILPKADAPASALRRIDSILLLAPVWALAVGLVV